MLEWPKTKSSILLFVILSVGLGIITTINIYVAVLLGGTVFYTVFFIYFSDYSKFKKLIPGFIIVILFQDLIAANLSVVNEEIVTAINNIDELFILLSLPIVIINNYRERKIKINYFTISILIILLLGIVSSIIHDVPGNISMPGAILMFKGFLFFFIFCSIPFNQKDIQQYIRIVKILALIVLFFAFIDLLFHDTFRRLLNTDNKIDIRSGIISIQSLFIHPGIFGWFMGFIGLYCLAYYMVFKEKKFGIFSLIFFAASFLSFRFKALFSIVVVIFVSYLQLGLKKILYGLIPTMIILVVSFLFLGEEIISLTELTIDRYINTSYMESARTALYVVGMTIGVDEFPFGVGFGRYGGWIARINYSSVYYEYGLNTVYGLRPIDPKWATDTYWPHIIGELGFIGAILWLSIFVAAIFRIYRFYKKIENKETKVFLLFSLFILIQSIIESLGEQIYNSAPQYIFIFGVMGIAFSVIGRSNGIQLKKEKSI